MAVVATGFFDGVHLGHRQILDTLVSVARARDEESVVLSFWPHPRTILQNGAEQLRLLTSLEEKKQFVLAAGVDRFEVLDFTKDFSRMTARAFLREVVSARFGATAMIIGYDHHIGRDRISCDNLADLCKDEGIEAIRPGKKLLEETIISSTAIRRALSEGKVESASSMLGRPYSISGVVVGGKHLGRTIGFPTANLRLYDPYKLIPAVGVYAVEVDAVGRKFRGMCNVGDIVETNIFDFDEQIYGLDMKVSFLRRIRDEIQFNSLDLLKNQLRVDREACLLPLVLDTEPNKQL